MKKYLLALAICMTLPVTMFADNGSTLQEDALTKEFAQVQPGIPIHLPSDHLPHPKYRIEWWYFTANVWDKQDRHYGLQFTLFRQTLFAKNIPQVSSPWLSQQSWMAHSAISNTSGHTYEERFARGGIGQAGVRFNSNKQFEAWIDDWQWLGDEYNPVDGTLNFSVKDTNIHLILDGEDKWVKHGDDGFSQKSEQQASFYYSHPAIEVKGHIELQNGETRDITGTGWLDREWSSQFMSLQQKGWDWFSLQLHDGSRLMLFQLRNDQGKSDFQSGTWINQKGEKTALSEKDIEMTALDYTAIQDKKVPTKWQLTLSTLNRSWIIEARYKNSWLDTLYPYWEGPIDIYDNRLGHSVGVGFLEMTGY